ncbi:MAG: sulfatase-like hydrolase/transferase, partial [Candidatus Saccharibacteria bacterium]|nr:sulfatase-like hydrolase/transferase [Candidatus Saccharibacteria bacterium]
YKITDESIDEETRKQIETYFQSLHSSDKYLGEFIDSLDKMDEKVVVLYFGDHSAGLFEKLANSDDKKLVDLAHVTPYFIYA